MPGALEVGAQLLGAEALGRSVAAAVATAGLPRRRYKKAPQTRRTSLDQPPPPTPPPAVLLSAPSAPPAAPNPGDPAASWAGSRARPPTPGSGSASPGRRQDLAAGGSDGHAPRAVGGQVRSLRSHSQWLPELPPPPTPPPLQGRLPASGTCLKPPGLSA